MPPDRRPMPSRAGPRAPARGGSGPGRQGRNAMYGAGPSGGAAGAARRHAVAARRGIARPVRRPAEGGPETLRRESGQRRPARRARASSPPGVTGRALTRARATARVRRPRRPVPAGSPAAAASGGGRPVRRPRGGPCPVLHGVRRVSRRTGSAAEARDRGPTRPPAGRRPDPPSPAGGRGAGTTGRLRGRAAVRTPRPGPAARSPGTLRRAANTLGEACTGRPGAYDLG